MRKPTGSKLIDIIPGITANPNNPRWKARYKYYLEIEPEVREEVEAQERKEREEWESEQRAKQNLNNLRQRIRAMTGRQAPGRHRN